LSCQVVHQYQYRRRHLAGHSLPRRSSLHETASDQPDDDDDIDIDELLGITIDPMNPGMFYELLVTGTTAPTGQLEANAALRRVAALALSQIICHLTQRSLLERVHRWTMTIHVVACRVT
jgi:hypothetical protein